MKFGILTMIGLLMAMAFKSPDHQTVPRTREAISWMSWDQAMLAREDAPRKLLVVIVEDDNLECDRLIHGVLEDPGIADYLNEKFYPVKLDLTHSGPLTYRSNTLKTLKINSSSVHELARELTKGSMEAPTSVFLNNDLDILQPLPGIQDRQLFQAIMTYYGDDHYRNTPWSMYKESFSPTPKGNVAKGKN